MRLLRLVLLAAMASLTVAFTGDGFAGCGGASPPTGGPLPVAEHPACFSDEECPVMGCEDWRCRSGQCTRVSEIRDMDLDGEAPPPCGMDCDDSDSRVFPGATETCNARDDDCDSRIDEDAPPGAIATLLGTADDEIAASAIGDRIVLTDSGFAPGLRLRTADFGGTISLATSVTDVTPNASDLCAVGEGGVLALVRDDGAGAFVIETYPLSLTADRALFVGAVALSVTRVDEPVAITVEPFRTSFALAWDESTGARFLLVPTWAAPLQVSDGFGTLAPLDLATDGTSLAVPNGADSVAFFAADGTADGMVILPGRLAEEPLASSSSDVLVGYRDTFDHVLARMTSAGVGAGHTAPAVGAGFPLRLDDTPLGVLVSRFDTILPDVGVSAQLLRPSLDVTLATFPAAEVSAGAAGTPTSFDVIASSSGTAIITSFGAAGSVLTVLGCQPL